MIKNLKRSVAEGGKIKIGGKGTPRASQSGGTWAPPRKDDHFTITTNMREGGDPNANLIVNDKIMAALAADGWADQDGKIRRLPIWLLSDDIEEVFPTAYVCYSGKTMACRGDGETAERFVSPDGEVLAEPLSVKCPCERLKKDSNGARRCKFNGILHCSLRIPGHAVIGSVYRWRTTSEISVSQIVTHLADVILPAAGTLRGLPLMLVLRPQQVSPGGKAKTVYVCHIDLCEDLVIAQRAALEAQNLRRQLGHELSGTDPAAVLQLPGYEAPDEQLAIAGELYPDAVIDGPPPVTTEQPSYADAPLAGILPPTGGTDLTHTKMVNVEITVPDGDATTLAPVPPAAPATPPPEEPKPRTRRTTCKGCGEMFGPGIVKKGLCEGCRATPPAPAEAPPPQEQPDPEPPARPETPAPEIGNGPPASTSTPYQRMKAMVLNAIAAPPDGRGLSNAQVMQAISKAWPDAEARTAASLKNPAELLPDDKPWTDSDIDLMGGVLEGIDA